MNIVGLEVDSKEKKNDFVISVDKDTSTWLEKKYKFFTFLPYQVFVPYIKLIRNSRSL